MPKPKKTKLNKKKVQLYVGKTQKIKLKNPSKKVKWKVANKKIVKIVKKYGKKNNTIKIKALKAGKTKITARVGKKKYIVKVTVKKSTSGVKLPTLEVSTTPTTTIAPPETTIAETTVVETTTVESTTEEMSTTEPTTSTPTEVGKLVAELEDDTLTINQNPVITFSMDAPTDLIVGIDENPYKLEIYKDGKWVRLTRTNTYSGIAGIYGVSWENPHTLSISLTNAFGNLEIGHYRYTHNVLGHYTNTSNQKYPDTISVEFDVVPNEDGLNIVASVKNDEVVVGNNLELEFNVLANINDVPITCTKKPIELIEYSYSQDFWISYMGEFPESASDEIALNKLGCTTITVPINEYFGELAPGRYRYKLEVNGIELFAEFDIIGDLSVTAKATDDKMTLGEELEVTLFITGLYENRNFSFNTYEIGLLEISKNGEWSVAPTNPDNIGYPEPLLTIFGTPSGETSYTYTIDLDDYYLLEEGHYRYTIPFNPYSSHTDAMLEFDVVK